MFGALKLGELYELDAKIFRAFLDEYHDCKESRVPLSGLGRDLEELTNELDDEIYSRS